MVDNCPSRSVVVQAKLFEDSWSGGDLLEVHGRADDFAEKTIRKQMWFTLKVAAAATRAAAITARHRPAVATPQGEGSPILTIAGTAIFVSRWSIL
ncbi:hypothetical protein ASC97_13700 [Rhizobium sp. Root1203]|uniref:hypothetical protein n=1 Tax=Rhizobium sp. Root1203 TaxID=1736427 RepID=UPI00070F5B57|nr:hypothetical protein [Rhizobium sp. Root1203]KQV12215.1 hypothetical protein ASC97_13700 [Rhizobium sp. Root1203]